MSLPAFIRYIVRNGSGETVTYNSGGRLKLKVSAWYLNPSTGKREDVVLSDDDFGFGAGDSVVDGGEEKTSEIDNTINKYLGHRIQLEVTHDEGAAADGPFDLYIDGGDATGELCSDASGYDDAVTNGLDWVGKVVWHSSGGDDELMRSDPIDIE